MGVRWSAAVNNQHHMRREWPDDFLDWLFERSKPVRRWQADMVALVILLGVLILNAGLGTSMQLALLFAIPVVVSAWSATRSDGLWAALITSTVWTAEQIVEGPGAITLPYVLLFFAHVASLGFVALVVAKLRSSFEAVEALAYHDPLTGLLNRRALDERLDFEIRRATRNSSPLSLIYVDVDDFKSLNDAFGHAAGDDVLQSAGRVLTEALRSTDLVARVGGDEFLIVLTDTDAAGAREVGGEILADLEAAVDDRRARFSAGAVTYETPPPSPEAAIDRADRTMYSVKRTGKGRLAAEVVADEARTRSSAAIR